MLQALKNIQYNTYPLIYHNMGGEYIKLNFIFKKLLERIDEYEINNCDKIEVITANSKNEPSLLEQQYIKNNIPHTILAKGKVYNHFLKFYELYDLAIKSTKPYILFADAYDVIVCGDLNKLLEIKCDLLFNAERSNYPFGNEFYRFEFTTAVNDFSEYHTQFLNSGVFFGKRNMIIKYIKHILSNIKTSDDQVAWKNVYQQFYPSVKIDCHSEFFQGLVYMKDEEVEIL